MARNGVGLTRGRSPQRGEPDVKAGSTIRHVPAPHLPWYRSRPSAWLIGTSLAAGLLAFAAPYTAIGQRYFGFVPLPPDIVGFVLALLIAYFAAAELSKRPFLRRYEV